MAQEDFQLIAGSRVGVIASSASVSPEGHIVELLVAAPDVEVAAVFSPEHGFRGDQPAGTEVADEIDRVTGLPVFSLYGATRKPSESMLADIDVLIYDLQDVGTRYYTYVSTMGLAMAAAAEAGIPFVVLDRPNPRGGELISGPVGPDGRISFVSLYPIPSVYGLTAGELARAIVGEGWIGGLENLDLTVVAMKGWSRTDGWQDTGLVWVPPSPGLPSSESAATYPSVVLFEATTVSFGQGTDQPFIQLGAPWLDSEPLAAELNARSLPGVRFHATRFTPVASANAPEPRFEGQEVPGLRIEIAGPDYEPTLVALHLLQATMASSPEPIIDQPAMFDLLAGTSQVRTSLVAGDDPATIAGRWGSDLEAFDELRRSYFLYD